MNASQVDASTAFGGGGFMPNSTTPQTSEPPSSSSSKNRDTQTILPLTIKQINNAIAAENGKNESSVDGVDVATVKIVGIVHITAERITDVSFTLDDGTGRVECIRWLNDQIDTAEMEKISNGMYVRVHGRLKNFQGQKFIQVLSIRLVDDYNEIASHFIECMYVHSYNTRIQKLQVGVSATTQPYMTIPPNEVSGQYSLDAQRSAEARVLQILSLPTYLSRREGANIEELAKQLSMSMQELMGAVDNLVAEGKVYSTVDEYHYKSTANA